MTMAKTILLDSVEYEMLLEVAKRNRLKPEQYLKKIIQSAYGTSSKQQALSKIRFLEDQLVSLDHYLPETYDYLMRELDIQKRILAELEVLETFASIDAEKSK